MNSNDETKYAVDESRKNGKITRERQQQTDEIFTNEYCTNLMLDMFDPERFAPGVTWLEPSAGDGNLVEGIIRRKIAYGCTPTEAIKDVYAIEYMRDNYQFLRQRILNLVGDTPEHREIVSNNIAYANTLDPSDTSDGRMYPNWMPDAKPKPKGLDFLF